MQNNQTTVEKLRTIPEPDQDLTRERVFVKGQEVPELAGDQYPFKFPDGEKDLKCYSEDLTDVIDKALSPIREYLLQVDGWAGEDKDLAMITTLLALEHAARAHLEAFREGLYRHIGEPSLQQISWGNGHCSYRTDEVVAVEFAWHGDNPLMNSQKVAALEAENQRLRERLEATHG